MSFQGGKIHGRLFRLSFSGEPAYEIAVPLGFGDRIGEALTAAGAAYDICLYGVEATGVLRIERGHDTHNEITGTTTAADLGMGRLVSPNKSDFIGRAMLDREGLHNPKRPRLVGLIPLDPGKTMRAGSHVLRTGGAVALENDQGHVTSSGFSPYVG